MKNYPNKMLKPVERVCTCGKYGCASNAPKISTKHTRKAIKKNIK